MRLFSCYRFSSTISLSVHVITYGIINRIFRFIVPYSFVGKWKHDNSTNIIYTCYIVYCSGISELTNQITLNYMQDIYMYGINNIVICCTLYIIRSRIHASHKILYVHILHQRILNIIINNVCCSSVLYK